MKVPTGFSRVEKDGAIVVGRTGLLEALIAAGVTDPVALVEASPAEQQGRGRLGRIDLGSDGTALVRPLQRGGLLGKLVRRRSLDRWRSVAELAVSAEAAARGATVLNVVAAVTRPQGVGYEHGLVTLEVVGARDLMSELREPRGTTRRRETLRAAGEAVRDLHDAGVNHVDLNLKNILLAPDGTALVIDLDRCRIGSRDLPWEERLENLLRLYRSWIKLGSAHPERLDPRDPLRFARAYAR